MQGAPASRRAGLGSHRELRSAAMTIWHRIRIWRPSGTPRRLVAALVLGAALGPGAGFAEPAPCALFDARVSSEAPVVRRGPMRNAFGRYLAGQHAAAARSFDKAAAEIAGRVEALFHPERGVEVPNEKVRRFLTDHVTGRNPVLRVVGDDFVYVPTVLLAWAESRCKSGDAAGATALLDRLAGDADDRVAPARAIVAIEEGAPERALALLGPAREDDPWLVRAVRALALGRTGALDDAWTSLDAARERCVGEVACGRVELVREALLALGRERVPPAPSPRATPGAAPDEAPDASPAGAPDASPAGAPEAAPDQAPAAAPTAEGAP